ncbi:hypothetical protein GCM10011369_05880 [Neiella marina]|uniref:Uncharacterized protein n=1 Tax=Neiella marina TaxID=508461 RepID=A0A8J2XMS6_9GAMM|nr:hypothetical protein [Neiella marina]GGA67085.1 hypothetical protein GCM10011369_05880 [Neiella marina]
MNNVDRELAKIAFELIGLNQFTNAKDAVRIQPNTGPAECRLAIHKHQSHFELYIRGKAAIQQFERLSRHISQDLLKLNDKPVLACRPIHPSSLNKVVEEVVIALRALNT